MQLRLLPPLMLQFSASQELQGSPESANTYAGGVRVRGRRPAERVAMGVYEQWLGKDGLVR